MNGPSRPKILLIEDHVGSKSFARVSSFSRHFQGAFLRRGTQG
jgi:hypothetical protein